MKCRCRLSFAHLCSCLDCLDSLWFGFHFFVRRCRWIIFSYFSFHCTKYAYFLICGLWNGRHRHFGQERRQKLSNLEFAAARCSGLTFKVASKNPSRLRCQLLYSDMLYVSNTHGECMNECAQFAGENAGKLQSNAFETFHYTAVATRRLIGRVGGRRSFIIRSVRAQHLDCCKAAAMHKLNWFRRLFLSLLRWSQPPSCGSRFFEECKNVVRIRFVNLDFRPRKLFLIVR